MGSLNAKDFIIMNTIYGGGSTTKVTEVVKETIAGPTKMIGAENISQVQAKDKDILLFNGIKDIWELKNISELLVENKTTREITIVGVSQGGYGDGMHIPIGTSFEDIIEIMLKQAIPASYVAPTINLIGSDSAVVEAGTIISPILTTSFIKNDAGNISKFVLKKNGTSIVDKSNVELFTDSNLLVGDTSISYQAFITYLDGILKNNNLGEPSPNGQIKTGTINSNVVTYTGKRNLFFGAISSNNSINSNNEEVRGLNKLIGPSNGTSFTLNIPAGSKKIIIAYPASLRDLTSVKYVEGLNAEIKGIFTKTKVNVSGINNFNPTEYNVYIYIPDIPFSNNATYNIII